MIKNTILSIKISIDRKVTIIANSIPVIPKTFPIRELSGDDSPLRARINKIPVKRYSNEDKFADIYSNIIL
tara:strand:+ start:397 stop:609 length:213 start_codon:yes stop_codon:yes gene_type:complete